MGGDSARCGQDQVETLGWQHRLDIPQPQPDRCQDGATDFPPTDAAHGHEDEVRAEAGGTAYAPIVIADDIVTDSAVRRLLNDAGDDIEDLMTLCEADITSKNEVRKKMFLENFRMVREKLTDLKEKDYKRLLQPVIDGNEIMEMFNLKPSREVGTLKQYLKDAVLDNKVENEREPLMALLMAKAKEMGLVNSE